MKILLMLSLITLITSPVFAATAVKLSCSLRKKVTISHFKYKLTTMKWNDRFQIASGVEQLRTKNNEPYLVTHFRNGDDLVVFKDTDQYYLFYADNDEPDACHLVDSYTYPIIELPRFHKPTS